MSGFIRNGRIEADDYRSLADDEALPAGGRFIVTLDRWQQQREALSASGLEIGVRLPNTADLASVGDDILERPLIALEFPAFGDGRAYSQARLLRDRYRYRGEIRATGAAVALDQVAGMARCGFTSYVLREDQDADACLAELRGFGLAYQSVDATTPVVARLRRAAN